MSVDRPVAEDLTVNLLHEHKNHVVRETPDSRANTNMEVKTLKGGSPTTSMAAKQMALKCDEQAKTQQDHSQGRRIPGANPNTPIAMGSHTPGASSKVGVRKLSSVQERTISRIKRHRNAEN